MAWRRGTAIFLAALAVRFLYVFWIGDPAPGIYSFDSAQYDQIAWSLVERREYRAEAIPGFPVEFFQDRNVEIPLRSFRIPGYPFFLAAVYTVFGRSFTAVAVVQILFSALTCVLIYRIGRRWLGETAGCWAGIFSCVYYGLFHQPGYILSETLFTFLFCGSLLLFISAGARRPALFLAAVTLALATLVRSTSMVFPGFICLWALIKEPSRRGLQACLVILLGFLIPLTPWLVRNYRIHHQVLLNSDFGVVIWLSNNPINLKGQGATNSTDIDMDKYVHLPEAEKNRAFAKEGFDYVRSLSAGRFARISLLKIASFLYPFLPHYDVTYVWMIPFSIWGMVIGIRNRDLTSVFLVFAILMFLIGIVLTGGTPRYRDPMSPLIILLGASGLLNLYRVRPALCSVALVAWTSLNAAMYFYSEPIRQFAKSLL
ncbi:glycosyltransferase family 39 protein [bacterium]|nr:glycosyltransferase family 39 protein [bacterium]